MFPSECVLERRVRSDGAEDLDDTNLPLFILKCKDRKAEGYNDGKDLKIHNNRLKSINIGVRLADAPTAVSYLVILGAPQFAQIDTVDKNVIVISLGFSGDGGRKSYLIYDAVALSLRLIARPENPSWIYTISSSVSIASSCQGDVYALVQTGRLVGVDEGDSLYLWRPSLLLPPWLEKEPSFPDRRVYDIDTYFSFNGHAYWVDLLWGFSYYSCDALFDDNSVVVQFGFIPLPPETPSYTRNTDRVSQPVAYRNMGVVRDSFIRFVSIDGFQDYVKLKHRTITVWKLLGHDKGWEKEHELSLKTLWGFQGFGDVSKDLTLMFPHLSANDPGVIYLLLGQYREDRYKWKFIACNPRYLLTVDMPNKVVTSAPLADLFPDRLLSCGLSKSLCEALVPFNDDPVKKQPKCKRR
ncbi:hypothetical protein ACQ4PT_015916 [Festuca glaucescens]